MRYATRTVTAWAQLYIVAKRETIANKQTGLESRKSCQH